MSAQDAAATASPDSFQLPVFAIVGPTASGKTAVAVDVAERLGLEIVAVDSMTIYRGMDVGTAKPSKQDRARVPHHMIDIADPATPYTVAHFQRTARAAIAGIHARGVIPLLTGGAGLYFRAVVDELVFPPADPTVRSKLESEPADALRERLAEFDPESAERIDAANLRRVIRALEVIEITGAPFSDFRQAWDSYDSRYDLTAAGLFADGDVLDERIKTRVDQMIEAGLVDEVRGLLDRGLRSALTASRAIAYGEIVAHLDGNLSLEDAVRQTQLATRRYARRQMLWFRRDPRVRWFDAGDPQRAAGQIATLFQMHASGLAPPG